MLQNATVFFLLLSLYVSLASYCSLRLSKNLMSFQPIKFFACCAEERFMKREECSVDPDTFEEGLVLQLFKMYYELRYCNRIYREMKPGQEIEDKLLFLCIVF